MSKMRTFNGLQAFRAAAENDVKMVYERTCKVTNKVFENPLQPAEVTFEHNGGIASITGPVGPKVKAGQKDAAGRKVISVKRAGVVLDVQVTNHLTIIATRKVG